MTPQDIDNLQNAINALQQSVNGLAGTTGVIGSSLNNFNGQVLNSSQMARTAGQSFQAAGQNIASSTMSVVSAQQQAASQIQQQSASMAAAANTLRQQIGQAASAVSTSNGSLSSLSGAVSATATGLGALAARLGIAQGAAAALATSLGAVGGAFLTQTQSLQTAKEALNRLGGVGQQTASSLYSYAHAAGLHSDTIGRMISPLATLGPALLTLGRGAGDAQKAFMELVQVGQENRKQFANIGVFQEEMMKYQSNYVAAQDAAGISLRMQNADMTKLRNASIEYVKNLYELSALTGEEVSAVEKRMRAAREDPVVQLKNLIQQEEIFGLRRGAEEKEKAGDLEGAKRDREAADRLEQEMAFRNSVVDQLSVLPANLQKGVKELLTTGVLGKDNLQLYMSGVAPVIKELEEQAKNARDKNTGALLAPEDQAKVFADLLAKEMYEPGGRLGQLATQIGPAALLPGNEQFRQQVFPTDAMKQYARQPEDRGRLRTEVADQLAAAMTNGASSADKFATALQEAGIALGQLTDRLTNQVNPLVQDFDINKQSPLATEEAKRQANPTNEMVAAESAIATLNNIAKSDQAAVNFLGSIADDVSKILGLFGIDATEEAKRFKDLTQQSIGNRLPESNAEQARQATTPQAPVGSEILRREGQTAPGTQPSAPQVAPTVTTQPEAGATGPAVVPAIVAPAEPPVPTPQAVETVPVAAPPVEAPVVAPQAAESAPIVSPPAEAPVVKPPAPAAPTENVVTAPPQAPVVNPPVINQGPIITPETTGQQRATTRNEPAVATESTPVNFSFVSVPTNLGTTLQINPSLVSKIAGYLRQSNDRERNLRPRVKLALDSAGINDVNKFDTKTLDSIIDKVAEQARLPIPPGSKANTVETQTAPVITPATPTEAIRTNINELISSGRLETTTPAAVAKRVPTPKAREGTVATSLSKLIDTGIIDPKFLRGPQEIPQNIITDRKGRKTADDANPKTSDTQGEGYGLDPKLLEGIVSLQRADFGDLTLQHITALNDYYHALNFNNTSHKEGRAVDFTVNKTPTPEQSAKIINILKGIGFNKVNDEYNNPTATTQGKHFHAEVPAQELPSLDMGGLVRGPKSGFPAMLHGNEMVIPLSPDSLLAELGRKSSEQINTETKNAQQAESLSTSNIKDDLIRANEMIAKVLTNKLDEVILKLDAGNQVSNKILRHSQV